MNNPDPTRILDGRLKLRHLILITTIAERGSLVAAAEALHVTQPVVTRGLRDAETAVGVELFERGPRGVRPTPYGEIMIDHALSALANLRNAGTQIQELQRVGVRPVHAGTNLAAAMSLLPRALVTLKQAHPHLSVTVTEGQPDALTAMLLRRDLDLVVGRIHSGKRPEALRHIRLYDEPVRIAARKDHPVFDEDITSLRELVDRPWILPSHEGRLREDLDELFEREGLALPRNIIECSAIPTVREILLETDSVAPLPLVVAARDRRLDVLPLVLESVPRAIGITYLTEPSQASSTVLMVEVLVKVARDISAEYGLSDHAEHFQSRPADDGHASD
jgi:DNA-binding transcriptional LysR family regulator